MITPEIVYENLLTNNISKPDAINQLNILIENIDDGAIRKDCINIFNKIDFQSQDMFEILENLLISDSNDNIRNIAAILIKQKFPDKGLNPLLWALQHEPIYTNLINLLLLLADINDHAVKSALIDKIRKIGIEELNMTSRPTLRENMYDDFSLKDLIDILINCTTLSFLKEKYTPIKYVLKDGIVNEMDFSMVDNQIIDWRYREEIQDLSEIDGIFYLKKMSKIKLFAINWAVKHEFCLNCLIELVKTLEKINTDIARDAFISEIKKLKTREFYNEIEDVILEDVSNSKLARILLNLICMTFLKLKYPKVTYVINNGEVIELNLEGIKVVTLPDCIKYLSSLTTLNLKNCSLYKIPDFLAGLKALKELNLELNNIDVIPNALSLLSSLACLNINKNRVKNLPSFLYDLPHLELLSMENNKLKEIPDFIGKACALKFLNLRDNQLNVIPESLKFLQNLQFLNVSSNNLKELPSSIWMLQSLKDLRVENNALEKIPRSLSSCTPLKNLNLEGNELTELPESLGFLSSLENLRLGWNKLTKLPNSMNELSSLKSLTIENNDLNYIPKIIGSLHSIENLNLSCNNIQELPKEFEKLKSLKILNLYYNQISNLPYILKILSPLKNLELKVNNLIQTL